MTRVGASFCVWRLLRNHNNNFEGIGSQRIYERRTFVCDCARFDGGTAWGVEVVRAVHVDVESDVLPIVVSRVKRFEDVMKCGKRRAIVGNGCTALEHYTIAGGEMREGE